MPLPCERDAESRNRQETGLEATKDLRLKLQTLLASLMILARRVYGRASSRRSRFRSMSSDSLSHGPMMTWPKSARGSREADYIELMTKAGSHTKPPDGLQAPRHGSRPMARPRWRIPAAVRPAGVLREQPAAEEKGQRGKERPQNCLGCRASHLRLAWVGVITPKWSGVSGSLAHYPASAILY